jgi:hypothetical protein
VTSNNVPSNTAPVNSGPVIIEPQNTASRGAENGPAALNGASSADTLVDELVARGLKEPQARRLLADKPPAAHERIRRIVQYFDELRASNSHRISKSPIGFLYRAVEKCDSFTLPGEMPVHSVQSELRLGGAAAARAAAAGMGGVTSMSGAAGRSAGADLLESEYLTERNREMLALRRDIEPEMLHKVTSEVEDALSKLKGLISDARFRDTVQHGVEEKLARLFAFPSFEEWVKKRRRK